MEELEVLNLEEVVEKRDIEFLEVELDSDLISCVSPIKLKSGQIVPCGHCSLCIKRRRSHWALRSYLEMTESLKTGLQSFFITLTYNDEFCPGVLNKKHLQDFIKRFRNRFKDKFKYIACGEYGFHTFRPHYHLIVFGVSDSILDVDSAVRECWTFGFYRLNSANFERCSYVSGYVMKKIQSSLAADVETEKEEFFKGSISYSSLDNGEFFLMSRRPGIGFNYLESHSSELYEKMFIPLNGRKYSLPRYFRTKLEDLYPSFKARYLDFCISNQVHNFLDSGLNRLEYEKSFVDSVYQKDLNIKAKLNFFKGGSI